MHKRLFIFDLDGTLVDAYQAIENSLNFTRRKFGYPKVSRFKVKRSVGRGDKLFVETFFPFSHAQEALKIYRQHHKKSLKAYSKLRPYAESLLKNLHKQKKKIAIASNRPAYYTNIIIKSLGIRRYLDYILCADQIDSLKPHPKILFDIFRKFKVNKKEAVYVGDMDIDLETARRAKVDFIFITGGSSRVSDLDKYRNKKVVRSLELILNLYN